MPPKRTGSSHAPKEETFFHVQLIDAERGRIRFGPFTMAEVLPKGKPETLAEHISDQIEAEGLVDALVGLKIWGGLDIRLKGDDGTDIPLWEVDSP